MPLPTLHQTANCGDCGNDGHNFARLKAHILALSNADNFEQAKQEWDFVSAEIGEGDDCPCGKGIVERCYLVNRLNGNQTYVGNVCVNRFLDISTNTLFDGLKRIAADLSANANDAVIEYADRKGYLYAGEHAFLTSTKRKQNLSDAQLSWKTKINRRILSKIQVNKR